MSYLGTILELEHGSRLTGVGLCPLAGETSHLDGTVYLHVVTLETGDDSTTASRATATFMPATLATIDGALPDGSTWFATFQLAADDRDPLWVKGTADAAVFRALALTGVADDDVWGQALRVRELRQAYEDAGAGDVGGWSVVDLLTGLLIDLTNTDLATVVTQCDGPGTSTDRSDHRRSRLHEMLSSWAATYDGPEA